MKSFLEYVAKDIIDKFGTELSSTVVVFPNKRASLFLSDYLVRAAGKPLWSPQYTTISDLFRNHSDMVVADNIKLVCDLHKCFVRCTEINETLDHFYGWGQLLLSDFDDIDKNMADAKKVFANIKNLHELDNVQYLTTEQIEIIKKFFSNFSEDHNSELKERFIKLWSKFYEIYIAFNNMLFAQGMTYEGALYRKVVTDESIIFNNERYIFIGFNVLQKVERQLFKKLKDAGKARFYWDFDKYYMSSNRTTSNEAGYYITSYLNDFPNELDISSDEIYNNFSSKKDIFYISAPTETIQARYISQWLRTESRIIAGRKTAIVLCNECLLKTVIHCIPDNVEKANITTGYPLAHSPFSSLINLLIALQTNGYSSRRCKYKLHYINSLLNHPYVCFISKRSEELYRLLNDKGKVYFIDRAVLGLDDGLQLLFTNLKDGKDGQSKTGSIVEWLVCLLERIASNSGDYSDPLYRESLFQMYTLLNRLKSLIISGDLNIDVTTLQRLISQIIQSTSIPFHGEPAVGIQIMGVLETRNLDFDHLLIISCNEGNMPKGVNDTSFIPYNIRKAYELTTIDHKVAIYSYYFHRLLQRAHDITIMYNSSVNSGNTGEMSRFMMQIMVESNHNIIRKSLLTGRTPTISTPRTIQKTEKIMQNLYARFDMTEMRDLVSTPLLTPSAINRYIRCQLYFYYNYVCHIKESADVENTMDNRIFGNIFHFAAQKIYENITVNSKTITVDILKKLLNEPAMIEDVVDEAFNNELFKFQENKTDINEYNGLQLINREVIIMYLRRLIELDIKQAPFDIIGIETDISETYKINSSTKAFNTIIGGRVDRIDMVTSEEGKYMRVVDYKTGRRKMKAMPNIDAIFNPIWIKDHSDYYIQAILYGLLAGKSEKINAKRLPVRPALLFIQHSATESYGPTLCFGKEVIRDIEQYRNQFMERLKTIINEIFDPASPFSPTNDENICRSCPYSLICNV